MKKRSNKINAEDALVIDAINAMKKSGRGRIESDVEGSYRGISKDGDSPVQDSDDL